MSRRYPVEDDKPWYRQFWPWFVFSLPAIAVIAGIATVIIANQHKPTVIPRDNNSLHEMPKPDIPGSKPPHS